MKRIEELFISQWPWKMYHKDMIYHKDCRDSKVLYVEAQNLDGITYIDCDEEQIPRERGFANAAIISAAPDMYKTEYDLINAIERLMNGCAGDCDTPSHDEVVAAIEAAKKALDKAAGEEVTHG